LKSGWLLCISSSLVLAGMFVLTFRFPGALGGWLEPVMAMLFPLLLLDGLFKGRHAFWTWASLLAGLVLLYLWVPQTLASKGGLPFGLALLGLARAGNFSVCLALLPLMGFGMIITVASGNTMLQSIVDDDKRGRVMSLYGGALVGISPLGSLAAGVAPSAPAGGTATAPVINVQVQAMDSQSFLDHSQEIARAARAAMVSGCRSPMKARGRCTRHFSDTRILP